MAGYKYAIKRAFPYTIPVLTGYLFIGIAFGVMFAEKGYSFLWAILMSLMVYAGSGQYLAVNFFAPGVSFLHVIFMTLMVNIRHVFYGISLLERFHSMGKKRWYMIFGLTDETYSLLCTTKVPSGVEEEKFLFVISMMNQSYWVIGSAIGGCVAGLLKTAIYAFAGASSVIALPLFVSADKPNNLLFMVISVLVGAVATFAATWVLYKPEAANK